MSSRTGFSRRSFLGALGGVAAAPHVFAAAASKRDDLPVIPKRLEKAFMAPGKMPNGLQATPDGLWVLDQEDPNKVHKVSYKDGSVLHELQTESMHGSGISYGNDTLWIASTWGLTTLKIDPKTGKTLKSFDTPGAGRPKWGKPKRASGAHGIEWVGGKYWVAVPPSMTIYQIEPETGKTLHTIPAPGERTHGIAWDNGFLWCVESNHRAIYKMDPNNGELMAKVQLRPDDPEPHGMTMKDGVFWYCDAASGWVCRLV